MDKNEKFLRVEMKYLNDAKYFEGINLKKDPGEEFLINLIWTSASEIRKKWESSKCKDCSFWMECGDKFKTECDKFQKEETSS